MKVKVKMREMGKVKVSSWNSAVGPVNIVIGHYDWLVPCYTGRDYTTLLSSIYI
jgi:hypothetical protein